MGSSLAIVLTTYQR